MNPEKRKKLGSWILFGTIVLLTVAEWNVYAWYEAVTPYGTLIASLGLLACFFVCVNVKDALKDPVFYLMAGTDLMALINIFLVNSGIGALLTIADFLLICYLANKMEMSEKMILLTSAYFAFFFFYWTIDVKGYFKGYNTNYGGLILVTGLSFLMILFAYIREYLSKKEGGRIRTYRFLLYLCQASMIVLGFDIIAWYRSRCALIGFLTLLLVILIPKKWWRSKVLFGAAALLSTFGAILVSAVYVWLALLKDRFQVRIFYKDILSGREELWAELWDAFLKQPMTGLGSNYQVKTEFMQGMFEVHNGLLDLLIVHGIAVFAVACVFLCFRLFSLHTAVSQDTVSKFAFAGMMEILVTSFFENYVIVPPFSLAFLALFAIINGRTRRRSKNLV